MRLEKNWIQSGRKANGVGILREYSALRLIFLRESVSLLFSEYWDEISVFTEVTGKYITVFKTLVPPPYVILKYVESFRLQIEQKKCVCRGVHLQNGSWEQVSSFCSGNF